MAAAALGTNQLPLAMSARTSRTTARASVAIWGSFGRTSCVSGDVPPTPRDNWATARAGDRFEHPADCLVSNRRTGALRAAPRHFEPDGLALGPADHTPVR